MGKAISLTLYLTLFLFFHLLKFPFQTIKAGTFSPNVTMHCELVEKKEVIVNMDSGVFLTQKSSSRSKRRRKWVGRMGDCSSGFCGNRKKRTETDNMLPFAPPESSCFRRLGSSNDSRATLTFNKYLNGLRVLCRNAFIAPNTR